MRKIIAPEIIEILKLLNGKTYKEAADILFETSQYIKELAKIKSLDTAAIAFELDKFNQASEE